MNALDRLISWVSPAAGYRRAQFRNALSINASYDAAKIGRRTLNWQAGGGSANAEIAAGAVYARNRSRDLIRNNPLARNAQFKWADSIVGPGILCRWEDDRLQKIWDKWTPQASADNLPHFEALQYLACSAEFESGDTFLQFRSRLPQDGINPPFQIQLLEPDHLDINKNFSSESSYTLNGIEFDSIGRRTAYWLFRQHPGDWSAYGPNSRMDTQSRRIPASQIVHVHQPTRPGQLRGIQRMVASTLPARDTADWEESEIVRKRTEACIAAAVTSPEGEQFEFSTEVKDAGGNQVSEFQPGMLLKLKPGEDINWNQPTHAGGYDEYKVSRQRDFAAGVQIPFELLTGNFSKANYSSSRMGIVAFERAVTAMQWNVIIPLVCEPVAAEFFRLLNVIGPVKYQNSNRQWTPPAFNLLDRGAEAKADATELAIGKTTWPQMVARNGFDPAKQISEIEEYSNKLKAAGIDFFNGQVLISEGNQPNDATP